MLVITTERNQMSEEQIKSTEELNQTPVEAIETNPAKFDATVFMDSLKSMKPASIKGQYIKRSLFLTPWVHPSL